MDNFEGVVNPRYGSKRNVRNVPGLRENGPPSDMRVGHMQDGRVVWESVVPARQTLLHALKYNRGRISG